MTDQFTDPTYIDRQQIELDTLRQRLTAAERVVEAGRKVDNLVAATHDHVQWFKPLSELHYTLAEYDALTSNQGDGK